MSDLISELPSEENSSTSHFTDFVIHLGYNPESVDEASHFAIRESNSPNVLTRTYFTKSPESDTFFPSSSAHFSGFGVQVSRFGRHVPRGERTAPEEEQVHFLRDSKENFGTTYTLNHIKGQIEYDGKPNNISVHFDGEGKFERLGTETHDGSFIASSGVMNSSLEEHFNKSPEHPFRKTHGGVITVDDGGNMYYFTLYNPDGKPGFNVTVPKVVDFDGLWHEWGMNSLVRNPHQPPKGIVGEGIGDTGWRYDDIPKKTGIVVEPVDHDL